VGERLSVGSVLRASPWVAFTVVWYGAIGLFASGVALAVLVALVHFLGTLARWQLALAVGAPVLALVLCVGGVVLLPRQGRRLSVEWLFDHARGEILARDEVGTLWVLRPGAGFHPWTVVEVFNATPSPDGTPARFLLRVPAYVATPREAIAWTFGFEQASEYRPLVES
jgi:Domain of unknown function (DUF6745)